MAKIHLTVKWKAGDARPPEEYWAQPRCVQMHSPRWWLDTGVKKTRSQAAEERPTLPPSGVAAVFDDGWNGSYHDCWYYPGSTQTWIVMGFSRKAGILGKMRRLARRIQEEAGVTVPKATASKPAAAPELEPDPNTRIRLIARHIWREEGD